MPLRFFQQTLNSIGLKAHYLPESLSERLLNIKDSDGNTLALYESDYKKLKAYLEKQGLKFTRLEPLQLLQVIEESKVKVIRYFSPTNLKRCELNPKTTDFSPDGNISTKGNIGLKKGGHQNCVVMFDDENGKPHIYAHPKVRSIPGNIHDAISKTSVAEENQGSVGVSHSSLSQGGKVKFAGSFTHTEKMGWTIENTTGHYGSRVYNMLLFLEILQKKKYDLSKLTVKLWIPNDPKHPGVEEKDYTIRYENAVDFLKRIQKSKKEINASLAGLSISDEAMAKSAFGQGSFTAKKFKK